MFVMMFLVIAHGHTLKQPEMHLTASEEAVSLIKKFEGFSTKPYICPAGIPVIGYGSTRYSDDSRVTMVDRKITKGQADSLLRDKISSFEKDVHNLVKTDLTQNQFDAIVSLTYNIGSGSLRSSKLLKMINKNPDDPRIKAEFLKWRKAGGIITPGLESRRAAEAELYFAK